MEELTKVCPKCKESKPRSTYHKCSSRPSGLQVYCVDCMRKANGGTARPTRRASKAAVEVSPNSPLVSRSKPKKPASQRTSAEYPLSPFSPMRDNRHAELRARLQELTDRSVSPSLGEAVLLRRIAEAEARLGD